MNQQFIARCGIVVPLLLAVAFQGYTPSPSQPPAANPPSSINPPPAPTVSVVVAPASAALARGGTQAFSATVTAASDTSETWSVAEGAAAGSITAAGVYSAPSTAGTFHVVATSVADPS